MEIEWNCILICAGKEWKMAKQTFLPQLSLIWHLLKRRCFEITGSSTRLLEWANRVYVRIVRNLLPIVIAVGGSTARVGWKGSGTLDLWNKAWEDWDVKRPKQNSAAALAESFRNTTWWAAGRQQQPASFYPSWLKWKKLYNRVL